MVDIDGADPRDLPLVQLAALQRAFETRLAGADPEASVPSCGGWSVRQLAEHLGSVHVWAAGKVLGEELRVPGPEAASPHHGLSEARSAAVRYCAGAELLRKALASVPADQSCQTLSGEGPASFWQRRQVHETLIHLWDLCQALGSPMPPVDPVVWADCVSEVVQVMHPRQIHLSRVTAPQQRLLLLAEDTAGQWRLPFDANGESEAGPAASITASAAELALLLWGRRRLEGLEVSGDRTAALAVLAGPLTP